MKQVSYMVFTPPGADGEAALDKLRLVRDGFSIWPLIFGPFWFISKRLWFGALISAVLVGAAFAARIGLGVVDPWGTLLTLLPSLLLALEAPSFERRKLFGAGWREADLVRAPNLAEAETRAMARLEAGFREAAPLAAAAAPAPVRPAGFPATGPVLGLFPEAAGRP